VREEERRKGGLWQRGISWEREREREGMEAGRREEENEGEVHPP